MKDVVIIGAGPAGLTAGIYCGRAMLDTLILEKGAPGGQIITTAAIENYPGVSSTDGFSLMLEFKKQAEEFGAEIKTGEVLRIENKDNEKIIFLKNGEEIRCRKIIIATGARPNKLGVPGEEKFTGHGVSYCATCDGAFFRNMDVAVIGGGNSAFEEALFLTRFCNKVYLIHRRQGFRAAGVLIKRAEENPKIEFVLDTVVKEFRGENKLSSLLLFDVKKEKESELNVSGAFMYVGYIPNTDMFEGLIRMDEKGYIFTDENLRTDIPGIFAAGDVRVKSLRQVVTAAGDGAVAAFSVEKEE